MADIPLKSDDEMTNDLVGAVENIAQSVKAGSRDFTKSFNGLTTAIKRLQTTLVNAIKSIKVQVVAKPEKPAKQPTKVKETSTKEVVKEKETKTEVAPEKKAKTPKVDPNAALDEKVLGYIRKNPEASGGRIEKDIGSGEGTLSSPELKDSLERLIRQNKILEDSIGGSSIRMYSANPEIKAPEIKAPEIKAPGAAQKKEPKQKTPKAPSQPKVADPIEAAEKEKTKKQKQEDADLRSQKLRDQAKIIALRLEEALKPKPVKEAKPPKEPKAEKDPKKTIDPQEKERVVKEKAREKEIQKRQEKVKPVKISSLIEGINQTGDAWSKMISGVRNTVANIDNARKEEEKQVAKTGKEGTKEFVGPPQKLFINQQNKEKQEKDKYEKEVQERQRKLKPVNVSSLITRINQVGDAWSKVISNVKNSVEQQAKIKEQEEKNVIESGNEKSKKFVGPLKKDFEENERKKALPSGPEFVGPSKDLFNRDQKRQKDEEEVKKLGKEGTKSFVGPPKKLFENDEKSAADAAAQAIADAAEQAADDAKKALERKNKAEEEAAKAEKVLRDYFRKKAEKEAADSAKAANDLIKQQEQAAKQLDQANQKVQKELDSMIAGFQRLTPLFKGPLVSYGLKMIAKGVGYKQPQTLSKGGDVSYLADGGDDSSPMKPKGTDTQPAMLTPGEFVVKKDVAQDPENRKQLESINSGKNKKKTEYHSSGGSVGGIGYYAAGGPVGAALGAAVTISGIVINSFTSAVKIASDAIATFGSFVAKANPAVMQKLEIIFNDLQGVIGRAVAPAFIYLTPLLRRFADYVDYGMKLIGPSISKVAVAFDNIVRPLLDLGSVLIEILNPVISLVSSLFLGISEIIKPLIQSFATLIGAINDIVSVLVGWIPVADFVGGVLKAFGLVLGIALDMITTVASLFVSAIGAIIKGIGVLISKIPFMGSIGKGIAKGGDTLLQTGRNMRSNDPNRIKNGSSTGAAVREVQSMSISSVGDEIRKNALMAASDSKSQEDLLGDISKKLSKEELAAAFADGLSKNPKESVRNLVGSNPFFKGLPNPVPMQNPV